MSHYPQATARTEPLARTPSSITTMDVGLIAATDAAGGIGKDGKLPWRNKEDMEWFVATTKGDGNNAVVMGRTTWQSLPHPPLANRINLVLSRTMQEGEGYVVVRSPEEALLKAAEMGAEQLWIIGGARTYVAFEELGVVSRKVVTEFGEEYGCDVEYCPDLSGYAIESWHRISGGVITEWTRA